MLIKDKDILSEETPLPAAKTDKELKRVTKENMHHAWGDAFDYYLRGITQKYLSFHGRASRLEFWGFMAAEMIVLAVLYVVGNVIEETMLAYYYLLATLIPSAAVAARRLHDINKKAGMYLGVFAVLAAGAFFISGYVAIVLLLWFLFLVRLFCLPTDNEEGLFGEADDSDDQIYGADNDRIIAKFRFIFFVLLCAGIVVSWARFDDWTRQAVQKAAIETIMDQVAEQGATAGLNSQQIEQAKALMKQSLKAWQGKTVSQDDILREISKAVAIESPVTEQQ
ncbi:MAG: DUF805 domain-containing protein [Alphaproteobacteria bacterium]|nr:DUF805 domain-containing protein [Alphaproteobacteria bacterium]